MAILWILVGLGALAGGAEFLVRGAVSLARALGIPPLIIGLTVVAFGTGTPELAVGVRAAAAGQGDLALGNVLGSNTFNVLFILGITAVIAPLTVSSQLVRLDVPVMIGVSAAVWLLALDGCLGRLEGVLLIAGLCLYAALLIRIGRRQPPPPASRDETPSDHTAPQRLGRSAAQVLVGLALLVLGAGWLVDGAVGLARLWGVSELMIGLTIVAVGTSLPEVATSIVAAVRGQRDIAVGNAVGSNIFNLLAVLGASAAAADGGIPVASTVLRFDLPVVLAVAVATLPVFFTGGRVSRWEGALFLAYYAAYVMFLIFAALSHAAQALFEAALLWFAVPLTALGIGVSVADWLRRRATMAHEPEHPGAND
ncbi:MAG TPA: calcium/sodium antiporter [Phycisphaerae bacterium]|nr:calcium/sodium antiporter [Phycisphaerae bacterium]HNU43981.1 calcium/sodium antiporter [Phycisphaerae bacterium]